MKKILLVSCAVIGFTHTVARADTKWSAYGAATVPAGVGDFTAVVQGGVNKQIPFAFSSLNGSIAAGQIPAAAITYAKIQNESASTLLGNPTVGAIAPEEITLAAGLIFSGTTLGADTGTSGAKICLVNAGCTFSGAVTFSGSITIPTQTAGNNTTLAASTAFVHTEVANAVTTLVVGPATATDGNVVLFNGATGKLVKDSSIATTDLARLSTQQTFTGGKGTTLTALTDAATITVDASASNAFSVTLGGNRTLGNPTNLIVGWYSFELVQDGTGSRTLAYSSDYKFSAGSAPVLSTGAGKIDILSCFAYSSSTLACQLLADVR